MGSAIAGQCGFISSLCCSLAVILIPICNIWAAETLASPGSASQMQRAELLYGRTLEYRNSVGGPADAYTLQALRNIRAFARQRLPFSAQNFVAGLLQE